MKRNGLVIPYAIFVKDMVYPERPITSGITDTNRKVQKVYQITLEGLIISSTRR